MCSLSAARIFTLVRNWITCIWTEEITNIMKTDPYVTCSLMTTTPLMVVTLNFTFALLCFKAYAKIDSSGFLSMNHEKAGKIVLLLNMTLVCLEFCCLFYTFGSICTKPEFSYLHTLLSVELDASAKSMLPPIGALHGFLIGIPELVYRWAIMRKKKNIVAPETNGQKRVTASIIHISTHPSTVEMNITSVSIGEPISEMERCNNDIPSKKAYILNTNVIVLFMITMCLLVIHFVASRHNEWWIVFQVKDLLILLILLFWIYTSQEIQIYLKRKVEQFIYRNF